MRRREGEEPEDRIAEGTRAEPLASTEAEEPPVVARLVVEIRSDGRRTIARGGLEDLESGQKVAIEARGTSPLALAASLCRAVFRMPRFARTAARALLPSGRRRRDR